MPIPFLAAMADHDGIRQIQRLDGPWEFRQPDGTIIDLTDEDLRFLITLAPAIAATLDRVTATPPLASNPSATSAATPAGASAGATSRPTSADSIPQRQPTSATSAPAARSGKPWSDQEDGRLIASLQSGAGIAKIAEAFGRTPGAIVARCLHLDVISVTFKTAPVNAPNGTPGPDEDRAQDQNGA